MSGGPFLQDIKSMYKHAAVPSETTHLLCAINPLLFQPEETFKARMAEWVRMIQSTPMNDPSAHQLIPGELEYLTETKRKAEGLPLPTELIQDLTALGQRLGLSERLAVDPA
jgi:ureidoglycolate dehydrogenase (NAD+)